MRFDIEPGVGALPIRFGMHRDQVRRLIGAPEASTTIWDKNVVALQAILAEWSRPTPYALRAVDLIFGGGLNGPFLLNRATVHSNFARDVLTTGGGLDLVFFDALDVLTRPPRPGEVFEHL